MNAPSQTLICNPEIEWSELLSVSFRPFRVSSHLLCLCECVRLIVKKWWQEGKKRKKRHTLTQLPGLELALLSQLLASRDGNLTTQPRKQKPRPVSSLNQSCYDLVIHRLNKGLFTWRWVAPGRWGNPLRWGNSPVHMISHFNLITFTS